MITVLWGIGLLLRVAVAGKLSLNRWLLKLPFFSLYILVGCVQAGCNAYFVYITKNMVAANRWYELVGYVSSIARVAMYFEAFAWFCFCLPNFRRLGTWLLVICSSAGLIFDLYNHRAVYLADQFRVLAAVERWTGLGVAVALIVAFGFFKVVIGGVNDSCMWHGAILCGWSLSNAVAWLEFGYRNYTLAGWLMVGGNAAALLLWTLFVTAPPSWTPPEPKPFDHEGVERAWRKVYDELGGGSRR